MSFQRVQEAPPKLRLDVDLNAPVVIVPQRSDSQEALLVDLGRLTLNNMFTTNRSIILENMELVLRDMKVSRVVLRQDSCMVRCRFVSFTVL